MSVIDTATLTLDEKKIKANKLLEEARQSVKDQRVTDPEAANDVINKTTEARALLADIKKATEDGVKDRKEEALAEKQERLNWLLEKADSEEKALAQFRSSGEPGNGPIVTREQIESKASIVDDADLYFTQQREQRYSLSDRVAKQLRIPTKGIAPVDTDVLSRYAAMAGLDAKALAEGTSTAGGFLVVPQYMQNLFAETRRQGNALRKYGLLTEIPTDSNLIYIPRGTGAATVGVVAENTSKPSADQAYSQVAINVFVWAGISKVSRQMVMDANPAVADLVSRELGSLLGNLEEQKIINGSGTGEPRGILNVSGVASVTSSTGATAQNIIDNIFDAVVAVQTNYYSSPTAALVHPRRLAYFQKAKDSQLNYLFNAPGVFRAPGGLGGPAGNGVTSVSENSIATMPTLAGLPIATSTNVPTTVSSNQDVIIVGDWTQAFWFNRQDVTMDVSDTAGVAFETNQVFYRLEERAGFSAERYPGAFAVVTGTNLANF